MKLMIPGPVEVDKDTLEAMSEPVRPHYGIEWTGFYNKTIEILKTIFGTSGDLFLLVGSGSSAIDACIGSAVPAQGKIAIGINGFFGQRLKTIAECYSLEVVEVAGEWGKPLSSELFEKAIEQNPDTKAIVVVHHETSTTIVNPISAIGEVIKNKNIAFIVDAVSSVGGLPLQMDEWGVDFCAGASQKCLAAPPGLAPVAVGPNGWKFIDNQPTQGRGWYLNLSVWRKYAKDWKDWHPFPITMATNNVVALHRSASNLLEEGISNRLKKYKKLAQFLREGLRDMGMSPYTPDEFMSPLLTAVNSPQNVNSREIVDYVEAEHNIKIAGGLGDQLKEKIFRIGHMSPIITKRDIKDVLDALNMFVQQGSE
jgi:alanine-glyoxylate transaminase/serine-glyoxylate transaminase/serine-pyruvate transaminase